MMLHYHVSITMNLPECLYELKALHEGRCEEAEVDDADQDAYSLGPLTKAELESSQIQIRHRQFHSDFCLLIV